jgi:hypothetical protein
MGKASQHLAVESRPRVATGLARLPVLDQVVAAIDRTRERRSLTGRPMNGQQPGDETGNASDHVKVSISRYMG